MLDEDIKKLLIDLNMTHFLDENEKLQAIPVSDNSDRIIISQEQKNSQKEEDVSDEELWQKVEDHPAQDVPLQNQAIDDAAQEEQVDNPYMNRASLESQVNAVKKQARSSKKPYIKAALLFTLLTLSGFGAYLVSSYVQGRDILEVPVHQEVVAVQEQLQEQLQEQVAESNTNEVNTNLTQLVEERKLALKNISEQINALISSHAEKKLDSFASTLTGLAAKCQAIDEEYTIKIATAEKGCKALAQEHVATAAPGPLEIVKE